MIFKTKEGHWKLEQPCLAPWHTLAIKASGDIVPDITFIGEYGNIKNKTFTELWDSPVARDLRDHHRNLTLPKSCQICEKKYKNVGHSRSTYFKKNIKKYINEEVYPTSDKPDIVFLEVNLSTKCNLKCRMCSGHVSTGWIQDELQLQKLSHKRSYNRRYRPSYRQIEIKDVKKIFSEKEAFRNLKMVALRGGEPLIEEKNFQFLDFLIHKDLSKNITLNISTNGTKFDPRLKYYAKNFKNIEFWISLEGVGPVYEYIRGGSEFKFQSLEDNIKEFRKLDNTIMVFTVTIMTYNIFSINDIWDWYLSAKEPGDEISFSNIVVEPGYLGLQALPKKLRFMAAELLNKRDYPMGKHFFGKRWVGNIGIGPLQKKLIDSDMDYPEKQKEFVEFTNDLDRLRGTRIVNYVPELKEMFSKSKWTVPLFFSKIKKKMSP